MSAAPGGGVKVKVAIWLVLSAAVFVTALAVGRWSAADVPDSLPASTEPRHGNCRGSEPPKILELELAGTEHRAEELVDSDPCTIAIVRESLRRDPVFILSYVAAIACFCAWGALGFRSKKLRVLGWVSIGATVVAAGFDLLENALLDELLPTGRSLGDFTLAPYATAASLAKWSLLIVPVGYAAGALITMVLRLATGSPDSPETPPDDDVWKKTALAPERLRDIPGEGDEAMKQRWWWATRPPAPDAWDQPEPSANETLGLAFSGGGIRSASFHLGVVEHCLDNPYPGPGREGTVVQSARYLATVSGGGYVGVARQVTLHAANTATPPIPAADAFANDSPEQTFVSERRKYLWHNMRLRFLGMGIIVGGIAINLLLFVVLLYLAARPVGWFASEYLFKKGTSGANELVLWLVAAGLGVVALAGVATRGLRSVVGDGARAVAACFGAASGVLTVLALTTLSCWPASAVFIGLFVIVLAAGAFSGRRAGKKMVKSLLITVPGALLGIGALALVRVWVMGGVQHGVDGEASLGAVPLQLLSIVLVLLTLGTLTVYFLAERCPMFTKSGIASAIAMVVAAVAAWCALGRTCIEFGPFPECVGWAVPAAVIALVYIRVDQRWWSPHVFYKHRLQYTFTPVRRPGGPDEQLDPSIQTPLAEWSKRVDGQPELLVCGAVHLPGTTFGHRPAGSFTFGHNIVGGPDVGWVRSSELNWWLRGRVQRDATLKAAMAISGAAIAAANGYMDIGSTNALLALLNARLGVWLPNPTHVHELQERIPAPEGGRGFLVRHRNIGYSLKEVFGHYDSGDRFVYVSDGGHHDNLGLIELYRRRCRVILCFDASGDPAGTVRTFEEVTERAERELGVCIEALDPDTNEKLHAGDARVAAYRICYPALHPPLPSDGASLPAQHGLLVFAKGVLVDDAPTDYLGAAERLGLFPRDSTAKQWFSEDRLEGYRKLGVTVAGEALAALTTSLATEGT